MKTGEDRHIITKILTIVAATSFIVTFAVGMHYYNSQEYTEQLIRYLLIAQNSVKAFLFDSEISLSDISKLILSTESAAERFLYYIYSVAVFVAPFCTIATLYKMLESLLHFKVSALFSKNKTHVVIFGYNKMVTDLLSGNAKFGAGLKSCRVHVVADKIEHDEEIRMLKKGIVVHKVDFLREVANSKSVVLKKVELKLADYIILYEEAAEKNFAVFDLLNRIEKEANRVFFKKKVKTFCRIEDWGVRKLVEAHYDANKGQDTKVSENFEIINPKELVVRKLLKENPLHSFYKGNKLLKPEEWHLHLLIVGFDNFGQQILLQAMNMGVVSSSNRIVIDVVDEDIDKRRNSFISNFNEKYVDYEKGEVLIPSNMVDGELIIRFHNSDVTSQAFVNLLREYGSEKQGGKFTYVAMCMKDFSVGSLCTLQINRYFEQHNEFAKTEAKPCLAVRCISKEQESLYKAINPEVVLINDGMERVTLTNLLDEDLDYEAKVFHKVYDSLQIISKGNGKRESTIDCDDSWKKLSLYQRNSNRALVQHMVVKEDVFAPLDMELLDYYFGKNGVLLYDREDAWEFCTTMDAFVDSQCDSATYPLLYEMSVMEHRRWCYFTASCGWGRTADPKDNKNNAEKLTPCLCNWEELVMYKRETCPYDMMWLLLKYREANGEG